MLKQASNPKVCFFHFVFKLLALAFYIFFGLFSDKTVLMYIMVISLNAVDFWTVKNVTGRILVGLRWWSKINDNGKEEWIFASITKNEANKNDARVFWFFQYLMSVIWTIFAIISLLSLRISNLTVCCVGMILTVTNTVGYIKCDKQHQKQMGHFIMRKAKDNMSTEQMTRAGLYAA